MDTDKMRCFQPLGSTSPESDPGRRWQSDRQLYRDVVARLEGASGPDRRLDVDIATVLSLLDLTAREANDPHSTDGSPIPRFTESLEEVETYLRRAIPGSSWAVQETPDIDAQIWDDRDADNQCVITSPIEFPDGRQFRFHRINPEEDAPVANDKTPGSGGEISVEAMPSEIEFWDSAWKDGDGGTHMEHPPANTGIALTLAMLRSAAEMFG